MTETIATEHYTPAPTPLADAVDLVSDWYGRQTGREVTDRQLAQVLKILLYMERTGRPVGRCRLVVTSDPNWSAREKRTDSERRAEVVGRTVKPGTRKPQYLFLMEMED